MEPASRSQLHVCVCLSMQRVGGGGREGQSSANVWKGAALAWREAAE